MLVTNIWKNEAMFMAKWAGIFYCDAEVSPIQNIAFSLIAWITYFFPWHFCSKVLAYSVSSNFLRVSGHCGVFDSLGVSGVKKNCGSKLLVGLGTQHLAACHGFAKSNCHLRDFNIGSTLLLIQIVLNISSVWPFGFQSCEGQPDYVGNILCLVDGNIQTVGNIWQYRAI